MIVSSYRLYLASTFIFWTALYVYVPILAPYAKYLGGSMTAVGLVVASYGFMQLLFRLPLGVWSDRTGRRKPFLVGGLLVLAAGAVGLALAPTPGWMIAARALGGLAACSWVIWSVMYAGFFSRERATAAMSHLVACAALGQMASTYAGGWIANLYGWRMPFYAGAGLAGLSLLCLLPVRETRPVRTGRPALAGIKTIGMRHTLLAASLIAALGQYVNFVTIYGFTPVYATEIGATKAELGALILVGMLWQSGVAFFGGTWGVARIGKRRALTAGFVIVGLGTVMIPCTETVRMLYVAQSLGGIGRGLTQPILMGMAVESVPQDARGTAMGIFQAVYAAGMFAGPAFGGVLGDWIGLTGVFLSTGAVCGAAAGVSAMSRRMYAGSIEKNP